MQTIELHGGARMPILGLGTWMADPGVVGQAVREALRLGYRHIDCAPMYGNEREIGGALKAGLEENGLSRDDVWITSKLWNNAHRRQDVRPALERTLNDLQIERLDLYLMHWPVALKPDVLLPEKAEDFVSLEDCPLSETWDALEAVHDEGLCRAIGVSNFSAHKLRALTDAARVRPAMDQVELHPYLQQPELLRTAHALGIHLTGYSPLGSPARPERLRREGEPRLLDDPQVRSIADKHDATPAQILLAWAVARGTAVIPKSVHTERLRENLDAASLRLDERDLSALAGLDRGRRYVDGAFWAMPGSPYTLAGLWDE
jgi:alcohol dehydrogenase (NADP+)